MANKLAAHTFTSTSTDGMLHNITTTGSFPYEPQLNRVILDVPDIYSLLEIEEHSTSMLGQKDTKEYRKKGSKLSLSEQQLRDMVQELNTRLVEAEVIAVGDLEKVSLVPGDKVMIYINQMEAAFVLNDKEYRIYPERNIICKVR